MIGAEFPHLIAPIASFLGGRFAQTIIVDTAAGADSLLWDDLKQYVRTHD
jgi:hypothetical protein